MIGGRLDKDDRAPDALDKADLRQAYERGRRDERMSRKRHPMLMTVTFLLALVGVVLLVTAAVNGSFTRGGGAVDQQLNVAAGRAAPAVSDAASSAGQRLREAGQSAKAQAEKAG
jgi:predicted anti-sigma-YlaC factor YlaD